MTPKGIDSAVPQESNEGSHEVQLEHVPPVHVCDVLLNCLGLVKYHAGTEMHLEEHCKVLNVLLLLQESIEGSHEVQLEDVKLCEAVQRGLRSPAYDTGRFEPRTPLVYYKSTSIMSLL